MHGFVDLWYSLRIINYPLVCVISWKHALFFSNDAIALEVVSPALLNKCAGIEVDGWLWTCGHTV